MSIRFDSKFWLNKLRELDYPTKSVGLDFKTLREQKALPSDLDEAKVTKLYSDDFVEVALIEVESAKLKRSLCTKTARSGKENRLARAPIARSTAKEHDIIGWSPWFGKVNLLSASCPSKPNVG
jgi:hypothetical protein